MLKAKFASVPVETFLVLVDIEVVETLLNPQALSLEAVAEQTQVGVALQVPVVGVIVFTPVPGCEVEATQFPD